MNSLAIGKLRGMQQLADSKGILTVCAIDHRDSLRQALSKGNPDAVGYQDMVDFKLDLCRVVAPVASAILLDPLYGAAQAISAGVLPGGTGLLVSVEKTGYSGDKVARITELLAGWGPRKIKRMGASAVKLLIYFRSDLKRLATKQLDLVSRLADECIKEDIPLLVEAVSYPVAGEQDKPEEFSKRKPELVIEAARLLTALPIDILKSEFPADAGYEKDEAKLAKYCEELSRTSRLPWVLLSAGVDFQRFKEEVQIACRSGASGFMAGRALWQEACQIDSREERLKFFNTYTLPRLKELSDIAGACGRPWCSKVDAGNGQFGSLPEGWYKTYQPSGA